MFSIVVITLFYESGENHTVCKLILLVLVSMTKEQLGKGYCFNKWFSYKSPQKIKKGKVFVEKQSCTTMLG